MNKYLDPVECPSVALAMGIVGMLDGYPLFEPIEAVAELNRGPEEPPAPWELDYEEEGEYY